MRSASRGFTLVELLVAVTMLGVLMVLLFSAMRTGTRSWQAAEEHIAASEGGVQAEQFIKRIIRQAQPPWGAEGFQPVGGGSAKEQRGIFEGEPDRFVLVAPGVRALPRPGLYRYEVFFEMRANGDAVGDLWVRMAPFRAGDQPPGEERLLQMDVAGFGVRYFGPLREGEESGWADNWPETTGSLPFLVEIDVRQADAPDRPMIIAAPMLMEGR
jgi:general secretion pathway protein J